MINVLQGFNLKKLLSLLEQKNSKILIFNNDNWIVIRDNQTIKFKKLKQALNFLSSGGLND